MRETIILLFVLICGTVNAHEGHGDENKKKNTGYVSEQLSTEARSEKYELLIKYDGLKPNEESEFLLYVSNYITNEPIGSASIKITCKENKSQSFQIIPEDPGVYRVKTNFPGKSTYSLLVQIDGKLGGDLILIGDIKIGLELANKNEDHHAGEWSGVWLFALGIITGLIAMLIFIKLAGRKTKAMAMLLLFCTGILPENTVLKAHEGHDENTTKKGNIIGTQFLIPKETQFLFEMKTVKTEVGVFDEVTKLYGTVQPSSEGLAAVTSAQNGRVSSVSVKVGKKIRKGDQLAIIEQIPDAASQVNIMAEKNNLEAEFEAATKDIERHEKIKDIISKKEADEAIARYKRAKENLDLFKSSAGKSIILRSPIDGIVGNFTLSIGSTITAGDTLFTVINLERVYIEAQVFDKDVKAVKGGGKFLVECTNDDHKTAEVSLLSTAQTINPTNQSQIFLFEMKNPNEDFKIGEFINIRVFASERTNELALPNSAISEINGRPVVFIKDAAEKISISYVLLGENNGEYTVIKNGVEEGERVIVSGTYQAKMIYLNQ